MSFTPRENLFSKRIIVAFGLIAILIIPVLPISKMQAASGDLPILWIVLDEATCETPFPNGTWEDATKSCTLTSLNILTDDLEIGSGVTGVIPSGAEIFITQGRSFGVNGGTININSGTISNFFGGLFYATDGTVNINSGGIIDVVFGSTFNINSGGVVNVNSLGIGLFESSTMNINDGGTLHVNAGGVFEVDDTSIVNLSPGGIVTPGDIRILSAKAGNANFESPLLVKGRAVKFKMTVENSFPFPIVVPIQYQKSGGVSENPFSKDVVLEPGENSFVWPAGVGPEISLEDESVCLGITIDSAELLQEENESNNEFTTCPPLAETKNLRIHFMPIEIKENNISGYPDCLSTSIMAGKSYFYLQEAFPVPNVEFRITCESAGTFESSGHANIVLGQFSWFTGEPSYPHYDYFVGVAKAGAFVGAGDAFSPESNNHKPTHSIVIDERFNSGGVTAHEMAHTQGWVTIGHTNECLSEFEDNGLRHLCDESKEAGYPSPGYFAIDDCELGWFLYDVPSEQQCDTTQIPNDFMYPKAFLGSSEDITTWVSKPTWEYLATALAVGLDNDPAVIGISGLIHEDGQVEMGPWYRFDSFLDIPLDNPGKYRVLYLDSDDNQIAETGFDGLRSAHSNTGIEAFSMRIPDVEGTSKLVIKLEGEILVERALLGSAPTTNILTPNGGELFEPGDTINIEWESVDPDGDSLTHTVFLSDNGGEYYAPIASQLTDNEFDYQIPDDMLSSAIMIKVVTTDGVNTSIDLTDGAFSTTVDITPPDTSITSVVDGNGAALSSGAMTLFQPLTITFIGADVVGVNILECSVDDAAFDVCTSPLVVDDLTIGDHSVLIRAIDLVGNVDATPAEFSWTIISIPQAVNNLIETVKDESLAAKTQTSLLGPLHQAFKILSDKSAANDIDGCSKLGSFINIVNENEAKGRLTSEQASLFRQLANDIMVKLGCT